MDLDIGEKEQVVLPEIEEKAPEVKAEPKEPKKNYTFPEEELQEVIAQLIKPKGKYSKTSEVSKGLSIIFTSIDERSQRSINLYKQELGSAGDKRVTTLHYNDPVTFKPVKQDTITYYYADASRSLRCYELAHYISDYGSVNLSSMSIDDRLNFLEDINTDVLDYIYYNGLYKFKLLITEALANLQAF